MIQKNIVFEFFTEVSVHYAFHQNNIKQSVKVFCKVTQKTLYNVSKKNE